MSAIQCPGSLLYTHKCKWRQLTANDRWHAAPWEESPMVLSKDRIVAAGVVQGSQAENFRNASYDVRVGKIVPAPGEREGLLGVSHFEVTVSPGGFYLEPQGMVRVISEEVMNLPPNIAGYALVRNGLSNHGILAINIGIIDPGYQGPVSSTLINFGKTPFLLKPGTVFLRLTFHEFQPSAYHQPLEHTSVTDYVQRTEEEVRLYSSPTFLNLHKTAEFASSLAFGKFKRWLVFWAVGVALLLAILTALVPVGASYADRILGGRQALEYKLKEDEKKMTDLEGQLDALKAAHSAPNPANPERRVHSHAN